MFQLRFNYYDVVGDTPDAWDLYCNRLSNLLQIEGLYVAVQYDMVAVSPTLNFVKLAIPEARKRVANSRREPVIAS